MNATRIFTSLFLAALSTSLTGCIIDDNDSYNDCWDCSSNHNPPPPPPPSYEHVSMFANEAYASSDGMPGSFDYAAIQATGAPDVMACMDDPSAWSSELAEITPGVSPDGSTIDEYLELTFPEAVYVSQVQIFESFNPGAIVAVDLESSIGAAPVTVLWEDFSGDGPAPCPSAFVIDVNGFTDYRYDRVVIYLDTNLVGDADHDGTPNDDYNSIDAVMMSGDLPL
jgi:hypothetical protein